MFLLTVLLLPSPTEAGCNQHGCCFCNQEQGRTFSRDSRQINFGQIKAETKTIGNKEKRFPIATMEADENGDVYYLNEYGAKIYVRLSSASPLLKSSGISGTKKLRSGLVLLDKLVKSQDQCGGPYKCRSKSGQCCNILGYDQYGRKLCPDSCQHQSEARASDRVRFPG